MVAAEYCTLSRGSLACILAMLLLLSCIIFILGCLVQPCHESQPSTLRNSGNNSGAESGEEAGTDWTHEIINESSSIPSFLLSLGWSAASSCKEESASGSGNNPGQRHSRYKHKNVASGHKTHTSKLSSSNKESWDQFCHQRGKKKSENKSMPKNQDTDSGPSPFRSDELVRHKIARNQNERHYNASQPNDTSNHGAINAESDAGRRLSGPSEKIRRPNTELEQAGNSRAALVAQHEHRLITRSTPLHKVNHRQSQYIKPRRASTGEIHQGQRTIQTPNRVVDTSWSCRSCTCLNPPVSMACVACGATRGERPSRSRYETDVSTVTFERSEKYGIE